MSRVGVCMLVFVCTPGKRHTVPKRGTDGERERECGMVREIENEKRRKEIIKLFFFN